MGDTVGGLVSGSVSGCGVAVAGFSVAVASVALLLWSGVAVAGVVFFVVGVGVDVAAPTGPPTQSFTDPPTHQTTHLPNHQPIHQPTR